MQGLWNRGHAAERSQQTAEAEAEAERRAPTKQSAGPSSEEGEIISGPSGQEVPRCLERSAQMPGSGGLSRVRSSSVISRASVISSHANQDHLEFSAYEQAERQGQVARLKLVQAEFSKGVFFMNSPWLLTTAIKMLRLFEAFNFSQATP